MIARFLKKQIRDFVSENGLAAGMRTEYGKMRKRIRRVICRLVRL